MFDNTQANKINEAMKQLSEQHRDVLVLTTIKGFSYAQAAEALGISEKAVRFTLSNARASLEILLNIPVPTEKKIYMNPCALGFTHSLAKAA